MITNLEEKTVQLKAILLQSEHSIFTWLFERLSSHPCRFKINADLYGLDLSPDAEDERINRCAVKFFLHGPERFVVFFYKRSLVPYSRSRFSYGCMCQRLADVSHRDLEAWLKYLLSGFHVERRPRGLRKATHMSVPE